MGAEGTLSSPEVKALTSVWGGVQTSRPRLLMQPVMTVGLGGRRVGVVGLLTGQQVCLLLSSSGSTNNLWNFSVSEPKLTINIPGRG